MKKTTGIIFVLAAALAAFVYFYDLKHTKSNAGDTPADTSTTDTENQKPAFSVQSSDIASLSVQRGATTASFEHRADGWYMTQPIATHADQSVVDAIADELGSVRVSRTLPSVGAQLSPYGLANPSVTIQFATKNGAKHKLELGTKDFSGVSVYGIVDDSKDVSLMSDAILTSSDKPVDDFRDQTVLNFETTDASSFTLKNESGEIAAEKKDTTWKIDKPRDVAADGSVVSGLLASVATARVASFVDDASSDLSKYGLAHPPVTFRVVLNGGKFAELEVGKKEGDDYYARDASRSAIFKIHDALYRSLSQKFFDFRDKLLIHADDADLTRMEYRDAKITAACVKGASGEWAPEKPADAKAQPVNCRVVWEALKEAHAQEIDDTPPASVTAVLAKPSIEVILTGKSGKKIDIRLSAPNGKTVYARSSDSPVVMKLDKTIEAQMNPVNPALHD
jgi:hypothetical protein